MIDLGSISRVLFLTPAALLPAVAGACGAGVRRRDKRR